MCIRDSRSVASPGSRWLSAYAALVYAFLYLPIVVLAVYSFNAGGVGGFPPRNLTLSWYRLLFQDDAIWSTLLNSFIVALVAVAISIILGLMAALALDRVNFPGKALFRRIVLLPLILPGIITGPVSYTHLDVYKRQEALFVSAAHTDADIERTILACRESLRTLLAAAPAD